jgi:long-chain fatty acid transport protein
MVIALARLRIISTVLTCCLIPSAVYAQGIFLPAGGAVNRGMGGATTGTAIEAIGSMYWNPATISQLQTDELAFGFEALYGQQELSSTFPNVGSGVTDSEMGVNPIPTIAWVHHLEDSNMSFGLGIFGVAGFSMNMPADATNPILSPPVNLGGVGVGGVKGDAVFFQLNPAVSMQVTEQLSIAAGPVVGLGKVNIDENIFVVPNANGDYPRGDGTRYHWGLGAQVGVHYVHNCCWEFGANVKTPTWFEPFRYFSENAAGQRRIDKVDITLPLIVTGGVAYKGLPYTVLTADLRFLNYADTELLGTPAAYNPNGSASGLGYRDQFAVALGAQVDLTQKFTARVGYIFATDLINDADTFFNIASDLSYRHVPCFGGSYHLNDCTDISFAYNYLLAWGSTGPYVLPGVGPVAGTSVTTRLDTHIATLGINVKF